MVSCVFLSESANPNLIQMAEDTLPFFQPSSLFATTLILSFFHSVVAAATSEGTLKYRSLDGAFQQNIDLPYKNLVLN